MSTIIHNIQRCRGALFTHRSSVSEGEQCATTTNANSLLIAILIMGIITFLGIGINTLIIKQIRVEHDAVTAGKAYFFAEAAIEQALLEIDNNLPGYERKKGTKREPYIQEDGKYDYAIHSQNLSSPCNFKKLGSTEPEDLKWQKLELNESITIPLYKVNEEGKKIDIKDFTFFYFVDRSDGVGSKLPIGDILRWKIIGQTNNFQTEAVSEYIPMDSSCHAPKDINLNDENTRYGEFGTRLTRAMNYGEYTQAKYYYKDPGSDEYTFTAQEDIATFLGNHKNNTLIVTNIIDISKQIYYAEGEYTTPEQNVIFFRIATPEGKSEEQVCLYSHIIANGYADNFKQSMDVNIKPDSFMPVFDFALYRTKVE